MKSAAEPAAKAPPAAYVVRMRPALAAQIVNKAFVRIPWPIQQCPPGAACKRSECVCGKPLPLKVTDRIFLVEYAGAATGRADLVSVEGFINAKGYPAGYPEAPGEVLVRRGYCTHKVGPGANVEDVLAAVSYHAVPSGCAMLDAVPEPAPPAPEPGAHVTGLGDGLRVFGVGA
jgi:hypothetical protein